MTDLYRESRRARTRLVCLLALPLVLGGAQLFAQAPGNVFQLSEPTAASDVVDDPAAFSTAAIHLHLQMTRWMRSSDRRPGSGSANARLAVRERELERLSEMSGRNRRALSTAYRQLNAATGRFDAASASPPGSDRDARRELAIRDMETSLAVVQRLFGEGHPAYLRRAVGLAEANRLAEKLLQAATLYERLLALAGDARHLYATALNNLALTRMTLGDKVQAESLARRAVGVWTAMDGPTTLDYATALRNLADIHLELRQWESSDEERRQALEVLATIRGASHPDILSEARWLATLYLEHGNAGRAEPLLVDLLGKMRAAGATPRDIAVVIDLYARSLGDLGRHTEAEVIQRDALALLRTNGEADTRDFAVVQLHLGQSLALAGRHAEAVEQLRASAAILGRQAPISIEHAFALSELSGPLAQLRHLDEAETVLDRALEIYQALGSPVVETHANALINRARLSCVRDRCVRAASPLADARRILETLGLERSSNYFWMLQTVALTDVANGRIESARTALGDAFNTCLATLGERELACGAVAQVSAVTHVLLLQIDEAEHVLERARRLPAVVANAEVMIDVTSELAAVYSMRQRTLEAGSLYAEALSAVEQHSGRTHPQYGRTALSYASWLARVGRLDEARTTLADAATIAETAGSSMVEVLVDAILETAALDATQNHRDAALSGVRRALAHAERMTADVAFPRWTRAAMLYESLDRHADAAALRTRVVDEATVHWKDDAQPHLTLARAVGRARAQIALGQFAAAEPDARRADELSRQLLQHADPQSVLSDVLAGTGRASEAATHLLAGLASERHWLSETTMRLAAAARNQLFAVRDSRRQDRLWSHAFAGRITPDAGLAGALMAKHLRFELDRQQDAALRDAVASASPEWQHDWRDFAQRRRDYGNLAPLLSAIEDANDGATLSGLSGIQADLDARETRLRQRNARYAALATAPHASVDELLGSLRTGDAVVEYVRYTPVSPSGTTTAPRYGAFVIGGRTRTIVATDLADGRAVDDAVSALRQAISRSSQRLAGVKASLDILRRDEEIVARHAERLRLLIWDPIADHLRHVRRVYIAPDGQLGLVAFEMLPQRAERGRWRYLIENVEVVHLGTARDLITLRDRQANITAAATATIVGDVNYDESAARHPAPAREAAAPHSPTINPVGIPGASIRGCRTRTWDALPGRPLAKIRAKLQQLHWQVKTLDGDLATEQRVLAVTSPRLMIFHTHGCVDETTGADQARDQPLHHSMLVLKGANASARRTAMNATADDDGFLTAFEISGTDLRGTQLVSLTACDTAAGVLTADGIVGLRTAFMGAGAHAVTLSMWTVPTRETMEQSEDFLSRWLEEERPVYEAFRAAQLAALRRARRDGAGHPLHWAGVVFVGDPGDLPAR